MSQTTPNRLLGIRRRAARRHDRWLRQRLGDRSQPDLGRSHEIACQRLPRSRGDAGVETITCAIRYPNALIACARFDGTGRTIPVIVVVFEVVCATADANRRDRIVKVREYAAFPSARVPGRIVPNQDGAYIFGVVNRTVFRRRSTVVGRIVATAIALTLAFGAFWLGAMHAVPVLDPVSILLMLFVSIFWFLLAGICWFKWDLVREAFQVGRASYLPSGQRRVGSGSGPPITRGGSNEIRGISIAMRSPSRRSASPGQ